jgi:hypothetical protein
MKFAKIFLLSCFLLSSCGDSSAATTLLTPVSNPTPKSPGDVIQLVRTAGPSLLKTFRSRMDFVEADVKVNEKQNAFEVVAEIRYHSFLKQTPRTARLKFLLSANGLVSQCTIEDPVQRATEVSCSQLETKIGQIFIPAFQ